MTEYEFNKNLVDNGGCRLNRHLLIINSNMLYFNFKKVSIKEIDIRHLQAITITKTHKDLQPLYRLHEYFRMIVVFRLLENKYIVVKNCLYPYTNFLQNHYTDKVFQIIENNTNNLDKLKTFIENELEKIKVKDFASRFLSSRN